MKLRDYYQLHVQDQLARDDPRWGIVQELLRQVAYSVVKRNARGIYGQAIENLADDVEARLLMKFLGKRLDFTVSFDSMLGTAARREFLSAVRRKPRAATNVGVRIDAWDEIASLERSARLEPDEVFDGIRGHMPPFRFQEYPHVRDGLLTAFLSTGRYPGLAFLSVYAVHAAVRKACYSAAIFDINRASVIFLSQRGAAGSEQQEAYECA